MTTPVEEHTTTRLDRIVPWALAAVAVLFLIVSLLGPTWVYSPANPAIPLPEMHSNFSDLQTATAESTSGVQREYFAWLGWALVVLTAISAVAATLIRTRVTALIELAVAVFTLVITVFAVKGPLSWSAFFSNVPNIRVGGYLMIIGLLLVITHAALALRPRAAR